MSRARDYCFGLRDSRPRLERRGSYGGVTGELRGSYDPPFLPSEILFAAFSENAAISISHV